MVRIGVLGSRDSWYARDLVRASKALQGRLQLSWLSFADLQIGVDGSDRLSLRSTQVEPSANGEKEPAELVECLGNLDAVLVRTMPLGSLEQVIFRMDCLHALERAAVQVINPPRTLETAIDKWLTQHRLHGAGLLTPPTVVCQTRDAALEAFERLGRDVLIKPLFGGEGRGILRIQDADMAWRACGTLQQLGQVMYVQQFQEHLGYDIRVLIVGSELYCIKRIACEGAWRTNLSQGSRAELHALTDQQREVAIRAAAAVSGNDPSSAVLGVDLLPLRDGRLMVLEVNAVPGWKGLAAALQIDIAERVLQHAIDLSRASVGK